jgi:hypothetical protein
VNWLSKRPRTLVPSEILGQLDAFGQWSWQARLSGRPAFDPRYDWTNFFSKVLPAHRADPARAVAEIHGAAGGGPFARYGGYLIVAEFTPDSLDPLYLEMMDAGLQLIFERRLSSGFLTGYERDRWVQVHGDLRTSFDRIVEVDTAAHTTTLALGVGETLLVARMGPEVLDNQFWIERTGDGYQAFSMRPQDSNSVVLVRYAEESIGSFDTAAGLLRSYGMYLRLRPYWAHEELDPFFPERREL